MGTVKDTDRCAREQIEDVVELCDLKIKEMNGLVGSIVSEYGNDTEKWIVQIHGGPQRERLSAELKETFEKSHWQGVFNKSSVLRSAQSVSRSSEIDEVDSDDESVLEAAKALSMLAM